MTNPEVNLAFAWADRIYAVDANGDALIVDVEDVIVFRANKKVTDLLISNFDGYATSRIGIAHIQRHLDPDVFVRVHRSTIINRKFVDSIDCASDGRVSLKMKGCLDYFAVSRKVNRVTRLELLAGQQSR